MGTTSGPEGPSDGGGDAEALNGDFVLGEDGELEGMSVDNEEMKDPEADDDESGPPYWNLGHSWAVLVTSPMITSRDHGGARAKAEVWSGSNGGEEEESEEGEG